jgi:dihydroorotate dehydrogenase (fumarate)
MNLETSYMGLKLRTPLVVSASPLSQSVAGIQRMEDAGASAVVLHSLFEEQVRSESIATHWHLTRGTESHAEALTYFPDPQELRSGPEGYLDHIVRAKKAVGIPVIASLNGSTPSGWTRFASQIQEAGADALEINLYHIPTDMSVTAADLVRQAVSIPVAVKLSPFFTNFANVAHRFDKAGADGLVLFNRFYQPDIDLEALEVAPSVSYSTPMSMRLPMRWIAILRGRVQASLAATSGVHRGTDALKMLMAGADVTMLCSVLMRHGIDHIRVIESELVHWMRDHECESVAQIKGCLSLENCPDPGEFERAQYMKAVGVHGAL